MILGEPTGSMYSRSMEEESGWSGRPQTFGFPLTAAFREPQTDTFRRGEETYLLQTHTDARDKVVWTLGGSPSAHKRAFTRTRDSLQRKKSVSHYSAQWTGGLLQNGTTTRALVALREFLRAIRTTGGSQCRRPLTTITINLHLRA